MQRNPYLILGLGVKATHADIQSAFMDALGKRDQADSTWARNELLDDHKRQFWNTQMLDEERWLKRLEPIQAFYKNFQYLAEIGE